MEAAVDALLLRVPGVEEPPAFRLVGVRSVWSVRSVLGVRSVGALRQRLGDGRGVRRPVGREVEADVVGAVDVADGVDPFVAPLHEAHQRQPVVLGQEVH